MWLALCIPKDMSVRQRGLPCAPFAQIGQKQLNVITKIPIFSERGYPTGIPYFARMNRHPLPHQLEPAGHAPHRKSSFPEPHAPLPRKFVKYCGAFLCKTEVTSRIGLTQLFATPPHPLVLRCRFWSPHSPPPILSYVGVKFIFFFLSDRSHEGLYAGISVDEFHESVRELRCGDVVLRAEDGTRGQRG